MTTSRLVRAFGALAVLAWVALALLRRDAWRAEGAIALAVAIAASLALRPVAARVPRALLAPPRSVFLLACAAAAAGITAWAQRRAMHGQPLSIDAGVYLLQARAMVHGRFGVAPPHPVQAFGDRFLLEGPGGRLYGIFPPGWPLAIAPFAALGAPMLAGPAVAVAMVLGQAALGRALGRAAGDEEAGELATRASLLLSLASIGRALETADLLSHGFVAALAAFALAGAIGMRSARRDGASGLWVGACVGWMLASRLLDGVVLAAIVAAILAWRAPTRRALAWAALGGAPFALLLAVEQHAATGAWLVPTQTLYFARSDWPPTCHRLGFGPDVGCTIEHAGPVAKLGGHGYWPRDALVVTRARAGQLGEDLLGWPPLLLAAFAPLLVAASAADAVLVAALLALTLAYGAFYYGNTMFFGARHLFPAAPLVWLLVARGAISAGSRPPVRGAALIAAVATAAWGARAPWKERIAAASAFQAPRSGLHRSLATAHVSRAILKTRDLTSFAAELDPVADDDRILLALDDGSGLQELRRAHPDLPLLISLPGDAVGVMYAADPHPGVLFEIERAWPSFVRPSGLSTRQEAWQSASGGTVLQLSHAAPGASLTLPFETATSGTWDVRVDAVAGPDAGDYALELDGQPLPPLHGYAPEPRRLRGAAVSRRLEKGRHVLVARCTGRDPASSGYDARLDALAGEPR